MSRSRSQGGPRQFVPELFELFQRHMMWRVTHMTHSQGLLLRSQVKNPAKRTKSPLTLEEITKITSFNLVPPLFVNFVCQGGIIFVLTQKKGWKAWMTMASRNRLTGKRQGIKKVTLARNLRAGEEYFISNRRKIFFPASNAGSNVELPHVPREHNLRLFSLASA